MTNLFYLETICLMGQQDFIESSLNHWQQENRNLTKESCCKLLVELKRRHLEPVLTRLRGRDGVHVLFSEIKESYATIERNFMSDAKGALDARAEIFCDFQGASETCLFIAFSRPTVMTTDPKLNTIQQRLTNSTPFASNSKGIWTWRALNKLQFFNYDYFLRANHPSINLALTSGMPTSYISHVLLTICGHRLTSP